MSTASATTFARPQAEAMPTVYCVGTVANIGDTKPSKANTYYVTMVQIDGAGNAPSTKVCVLSHPEWFKPGFSAGALENASRGMAFVYQNNVITSPNSRRKMSNLEGLSGGLTRDEHDARFIATQERVMAAGSQEDFAAAFTEALKPLVGGTVGYILRQKQEKTNEVDEAGKTVYERTPYYEVSDYFVPDEKTLASLRKSADRSQGKIVFAADLSAIPF